MITMNVIPEERKAIVSFPEQFKMAIQEVPIVSMDDAIEKWKVMTRQFIYTTLRGWTISRCVSYVNNGKLTDSRKTAVDKIILMLNTHKYSELHVLCKRIVQDGKYFVEIFPSKESRYYSYFKEVIAEILMWCDMYHNNYQKYNEKLIKYI